MDRFFLLLFRFLSFYHWTAPRARTPSGRVEYYIVNHCRILNEKHMANISAPGKWWSQNVNCPFTDARSDACGVCRDGVPPYGLPPARLAAAAVGPMLRRLLRHLTNFIRHLDTRLSISHFINLNDPFSDVSPPIFAIKPLDEFHSRSRSVNFLFI